MIFHSEFESSYLWLPLIGFIIGLVGTIIGGGGGFLFIPVLALLFNIPAKEAVTTALAAGLPMCIAGSWGHYRNRNVDMRMGVVFTITGIFGALAGAYFTRLLTSEQLKISLGVYSCLIAIYLAYSDYLRNKTLASGIDIKPVTATQKLHKGSFFGLLAGFITGTFATSGVAPVQVGMFSMNMPLKLVIGTSLVVVTTNTISALGAHFMVGVIDMTLVYFLTAGSILGALAGSKVVAVVKTDKAEGPVKNLYAIGMFVFGILMIVF